MSLHPDAAAAARAWLEGDENCVCPIPDSRIASLTALLESYAAAARREVEPEQLLLIRERLRERAERAEAEVEKLTNFAETTRDIARAAEWFANLDASRERVKVLEEVLKKAQHALVYLDAPQWLLDEVRRALSGEGGPG